MPETRCGFSVWIITVTKELLCDFVTQEVQNNHTQTDTMKLHMKQMQYDMIYLYCDTGHDLLFRHDLVQ